MVALAILAALAGLAGCDQDKVLYSGRNYLMFSDTLYHYAVQESNEKFEVPVSATRRADYDRTFAVEVVDKESNAVEGKHYRILSNTVTETKVVMQKVCPFDINAFTGYCKVTSSLFNTYMTNTTLRLITSEVVEGEENTIVLHGLYFDGYDTKLKFNYDDLLEPSIEMEEHVCGSTAELFDTTHGNGKLMMTQPSGYPAYFSTCEKFVFHYVNIRVDNKDGSLVGVVDTPANIIEWISEAEAEKLKEQGY